MRCKFIRLYCQVIMVQKIDTEWYRIRYVDLRLVHDACAPSLVPGKGGVLAVLPQVTRARLMTRVDVLQASCQLLIPFNLSPQ